MTHEPQYDVCFDRQPARLGFMSGFTWRTDPRRLGFVLARYKFVAKMLAGMDAVLEVGCGDGFATAVVAQAVTHVVAVDMDERFIDTARGPGNVIFRKHNMIDGPLYAPDRLPRLFSGAYCMDVLEHIPPHLEGRFLGCVCESIREDGVLVVGMPSLESQPHASAESIAGHVNCKSDVGLRDTMRRYFRHVFVFGMNDETLHTGFGPMCHYLLAVCAGVKR